jgi:hypothetical protein
MKDRCTVKGCRGPADIGYLGKGICDEHWNQLANNRKKLRAALGLKEEKNGPDPVSIQATGPKADEVDLSGLPGGPPLSDAQIQLEVLGLYKRPSSVPDLPVAPPARAKRRAKKSSEAAKEDSSG